MVPADVAKNCWIILLILFAWSFITGEMLSTIVSRIVILVFGTLYPAYASYKSVRSKNIREYVKWMMYWIVFALFTTAETFTDVFLGFWFPFYYEVKVIIVFWLLSPMTNGSSFLYRKFVHPMLSKREQDIDEYIARAKDQGYSTVLSLGTKGVNYATAVIMQTAIKNLGLPASVAPETAPQQRAIRAPPPADDETDFALEHEEPALSAYSDDEDAVARKSVRKRAAVPRTRRATRQTAPQISDDEAGC